MTKQKECKHCHGMFSPRNSMDKACSPDCAIALIGTDPKTVARAQKLVKREVAERDRARKESTKTIPQLKATLQTLVNAVVRARDRAKGCFVCGKPFPVGRVGGDFDAGHIFSRGAADHLRYNLDNIHGECKPCNSSWGAKPHQIKAGAIHRIGQERYDALESNHESRKWRRDELVEQIALYRAKLKELLKGME